MTGEDVSPWIWLLGIFRSPLDIGVIRARRLFGTQSVQREEFRVDLRVNRAPRWVGVGVRVPPWEGGCGADKSVYLALETLPEFGSRAGVTSPLPPSVSISGARAALPHGSSSGTGAPRRCGRGPSPSLSKDPLPPRAEEWGKGLCRA